ncbi:SusC/RagA family TonB-linked outer membrane protein [Leptobacterium flavescens]|uniref:SusC/RagA family TonB-linked outer membrane protein n=1 Tax=Leptobacterium flavescens TaxID=472055 RepID=A0A6P0ULC7_9FLAO|nr:SusC/RagA family TonB-linked outer membrane protein [Leptobacterium flavescens]NER13777.1 SusC/RagA family TonB-linked outer membrane protein [Leptobacterium flavescens]
MRKLPKWDRDLFPFPRFDLKTGLVFLFMGIAIFGARADSYSQHTKITLNLTGATIAEVIDHIESKTEFRFVYKMTEVDTDRKVSVKVVREKMIRVLDLLFAGTDTEYRILNRQVILKKARTTNNIPKNTASADQETILIDGKVTDENGIPLTGASIVEKGTSNGVITDFEGSYVINVASKDAVLVFSYLGYISQEIQVGDRTTINVSLKTAVEKLDHVVVTALGIKRAEKALTYSAQSVGGEELSRIKDPSPINSLSGKVAGLNINRSSSGAGGSVKVVLRGNSSTRNNQPLYVIDGIPILNVNVGQPNDPFGSLIGGARDTGDAISLLNPDDIESINVLKGASASALYGSQGANGVIIINTRRGKEGEAKVIISSNITTENVFNLPDFQTEYEATASTAQTTWGGRATVEDHVKGFFQTGLTAINSVSLSSGNKKAQTYLSYSNTSTKGTLPTNNLNRHNLNVRETAGFFDDRLSLDASITVSKQTINNRPIAGFWFSPLTGLYLMPRGKNDFDELRENFEVFDPTRNLFVENWPIDEDIEQNPYWVLHRQPSIDRNQRFVGALALTGKINDWLSLQSRISYDRLYSSFEKRIHAGRQTTLGHVNGRYIEEHLGNTQVYGDVIASIDTDINEDLDFTVNIGSSITKSTIGELTYFDSQATGGGLKLANWFTLANFNSTIGIGKDVGQRKELQSLFGSIQAGYKGMLYADITARNDWSSTLDRSYFYPSFGLSAILSELLDMPEDISFSKIRISYGEVGNDVPSFLTNPINLYRRGGGSITPLIGTLEDTTLRPEKQRSFEIGTEWKFFEAKLGLALTYYRTNTIDQFFQIPAPSSNPQGYDFFAVNAGNIENKGIELSLEATLMSSEGFNWNTLFNYASNQSKVQLADVLGGKSFLTPPTGIVNYNYALVDGEAFGSIEGIKLTRNEDGKPIIERDDNGNIIGLTKDGEMTTVGNANPDWILGWNNAFSYGNFTLNFLIDARFGGDVMSLTQAMLDDFGVSQQTADARNAGGVTLDAVEQDGTPFTGTIPAEIYYRSVAGRSGATGEYVYDATNINFRELRLGYRFDLSQENFFKSLDLSLIGRNLFFIYKKAPFDPNVSFSTAEGSQGVESFSSPITRSIGMNIRITL